MLEINPNFILNIPLKLPVRIRKVNNVPKLIAGGVPIAPINLVLKQRLLTEGATPESIDTYSRAAYLYVEFCAHRNQSILNVSNEEFTAFQNALLGLPFLDTQGKSVCLRGKLGKRTADLMITLLYSLAADIAELYGVYFDWRRYKGIPHHPTEMQTNLTNLSHSKPWHFPRSHHIKWIPNKVTGLPDDQFVLLLKAAYERWGKEIVDGDLAFANDPQAQRGALFYRNVAILMVLRCAGSRRAEVIDLRFDDIDRARSLIYLTTKGHRIEAGSRLPVLLLPLLYEVIWHYVTHFRPEVSRNALQNQQAIFVSHSVRNYGEQLSDESIRAIINILRPALAPPWNTRLTPHKLRHSYGYDLQKLGGPSAVTSNMRHRSSRSGEPYAAGPENFAEEIALPANQKLELLFAQAGLLEIFHEK